MDIGCLGIVPSPKIWVPVPVARGLADGEVDERRGGHARRERAHGARDGHGLFRECLHGGHVCGGRWRRWIGKRRGKVEEERVGRAGELAVGRDELKRMRSEF